MVEPFYEQHQTNRGLEPAIRPRFESDDPLEYKVTQADLMNWPNFLYHSLADTFYDDTGLWWIIADANPIRRAKDWSVGETIIIPKDFRDALVSTQEEAELQRKLF
ncbi:MAG TPA: hypothetical protein DCE42_28190 [Myxococcales bacterium]|nr:hypothetical protein [Deltaproteobacteria bacterium]MBU53500.1 hypothetical protein [Deltaproteobacteria bacterium]HAA58675.1 hypothetical protein [Myxococcales bacterium]|tara:strand:- start:23248 stop:23565 length:318 start_codon:yes stop_codon:yes gene_type:complete